MNNKKISLSNSDFTVVASDPVSKTLTETGKCIGITLLDKQYLIKNTSTVTIDKFYKKNNKIVRSRTVTNNGVDIESIFIYDKNGNNIKIITSKIGVPVTPKKLKIPGMPKPIDPNSIEAIMEYDDQNRRTKVVSEHGNIIKTRKYDDKKNEITEISTNKYPADVEEVKSGTYTNIQEDITVTNTVNNECIYFKSSRYKKSDKPDDPILEYMDELKIYTKKNRSYKEHNKYNFDDKNNIIVHDYTLTGFDHLDSGEDRFIQNTHKFATFKNGKMNNEEISYITKIEYNDKNMGTHLRAITKTNGKTSRTFDTKNEYDMNGTRLIKTINTWKDYINNQINTSVETFQYKKIDRNIMLEIDKFLNSPNPNYKLSRLSTKWDMKSTLSGNNLDINISYGNDFSLAMQYNYSTKRIETSEYNLVSNKKKYKATSDTFVDYSGYNYGILVIDKLNSSIEIDTSISAATEDIYNDIVAVIKKEFKYFHVVDDFIAKSLAITDLS